MSAKIGDAIRALVDDKGISEELIWHLTEDFILAAYKKAYDTVENAIVEFSEDKSEVKLFATKKIVDLVYNEALEIELEDALKLNSQSELGDELQIEINLTDFDRKAISTAKQRVLQSIRDIQKDTLYSEFIQKKGEILIGYHQRERNGNIFVDLGTVEGILPKRFQSPRESYGAGDRIKALLFDVNKDNGHLSIVLSRTDSDFVKRLFEVEVPEVYDGIVEIHKIVRDPGYRTKLAVISSKSDVDPVGACVGLKGSRIQNIIRELEGEKIDVLKYDINPIEFIKNALSPAEVKTVVILDSENRKALAVVDESQLSFAIGKQGQNVKLANRLVDWTIDVKTVEQFSEMDIAIENKNEFNALFNNHDQDDEISDISELPGIQPHLVEILADSGYTKIEEIISMNKEEMSSIVALTEKDVDRIKEILSENVEIDYDQDDLSSEADNDSDDFVEVSEDEKLNTFQDAAEDNQLRENEEYVEVYECPECNSEITIDMTICPKCGTEFSFEEEEVKE